MCGICGFVGIREDGLLERMTEALHHRGPDGAGYFCADDVGLGHRRLSIIDVAGGRQPIENEDGSLVLIHNGEIYNHRELRRDLEANGHTFRTVSDSEVILHLYEDFGVRCLEKMGGMWAFALYDRRRRRLFIARDRLGIKPLYYVESGDRFLFASEIKALLRFDGFQPTLNLQAVHDYLALRYVPGPGGLFNEVRKLPAAHHAIVEDGRTTVTRYWTPAAASGPSRRRTDEEYIEEFAERFERSIARRLMSEVPLGAYLSGGLDSSTIVAAMSRLTSQPVRTFTVGFDFEHDELHQAAETARQLGCVHTEIPCRAADVELLPQIVWHLDEPIGDPIVIPMYQLARRAKQDVTVVLAGEGADETLGGYLFHRALLAGGQLARVPRVVRDWLIGPLLKATPASVLNLAFQYPAALGDRGKLKVLDFLPLVGGDQLPAAYRHLISLFDDRDTEWLYTDDFKAQLRSSHPAAAPGATAGPYLDRILALQFDSWLPEDILTKQDKMSMAHGIEARVPFLDHELVEFTFTLPPSLKIRRGVSKYILRKYAQRLLPASTAGRKKMPFYVPAERYLAEPAFQAMLADTLSDRSVRARGLLKPEAVARLRNSMQTGEFMFVKQAISLMMLELWFRMAVDRRGVA